MNTQPAIKNYFFEKAYLDLKLTIGDSWKSNIASANDLLKKAEAAEQFYKYLYITSGISVFVFGTLCFSLISLIHVIIVSVLTLLIYLLFSLVWSFDAGYRFKNSIFTACPHCYSKSSLPVYHCSKCHAEHDQLWPGKYGILRRTCTCGEALPTTFFNGRSELKASCVSCKQPIEASESRPIVIPIIGAPSVGKTFFVFSLVYHIREKLATRIGQKFEFMNKSNEGIYNAEITTLNSGQPLRKTTENNPTALNFFLSKDDSTRSLFYFYDSAGEAFSNTQYLSQHKFYDYFNGLIFIIDPFSIPEVSTTYSHKLSSNSNIRPSTYPLEDVYDASIINLEKNYNLKVTDRISKPTAIIFSKVDAFDLSEIIGEKAIDIFLAANPKVKDRQEAMNLLCKKFLSDNGMDALLRKMEWKFSNARFFAISSGGKNSTGIDNVANWLLGKIDKSYNVN